MYGWTREYGRRYIRSAVAFMTSNLEAGRGRRIRRWFQVVFHSKEKENLLTWPATLDGQKRRRTAQQLRRPGGKRPSSSTWDSCGSEEGEGGG